MRQFTYIYKANIIQSQHFCLSSHQKQNKKQKKEKKPKETPPHPPKKPPTHQANNQAINTDETSQTNNPPNHTPPWKYTINNRTIYSHINLINFHRFHCAMYGFRYILNSFPLTVPIRCYMCLSRLDKNDTCNDPVDSRTNNFLKDEECHKGVCVKWTRYINGEYN